VRSVPDEPEAAATALDWARLRAEALEPLVAGRVARYRPSDRARPTGERAGPGSGLVRTLHPAPVVVVEGVDSARPELADLVTVAVLLRAAGDRRAQRPDARGDAVGLGSLGERGERHPLITVLTPADLGLVIEEEIGHEHGA
jgi:para-aminobenzoate synthetase